MAKPLPVGTDTDEPTALLYLNPVEYRIVKHALERYLSDRVPGTHDPEYRNFVQRIVDKLNGEVMPYGS